MSDKPLWQLSASEQAEAIASKKVTSVEVVGASIERMKATNAALNAVVDDLSESALAQAKEHDAIMAASGPIGPLHGVPVTIKVNVDQEGRASTNGVVALKDMIAPGDAPIVTNFTKAGAIVIGRTNTPEFSFRATTSNELHGRTFSPWNDWATSGGSSGGASSAVMAGMGSLAHGNDIGGSLRYPAAATGAATVKPGLGRTPAWNPSQQAERGLLAQLMSVQGVIAREVRDVRLAMKSLIAYDAQDVWQVAMPFDGPKPEGKIKVAFTKNTFDFDLDPAISVALDHARDCLVDAGYEVVEVEPPLINEIAEVGGKCLFGEAKALMLDDIRKYGSATINKIFDSYFEYFEPYEGKDLLLGMAKRSYYIRQWQLFMQDYPLVLTPFLPMQTPVWNLDEIEGAKEALGTGIYSFSMNYMGLPAGNIPAAYNDDLPIAVQIVAPRFREDMILDACEAIEQRTGVMAERLFERG